jgi:hypothetical protein
MGPWVGADQARPARRVRGAGPPAKNQPSSPTRHISAAQSDRYSDGVRAARAGRRAGSTRLVRVQLPRYRMLTIRRLRLLQRALTLGGPVVLGRRDFGRAPGCWYISRWVRGSGGGAAAGQRGGLLAGRPARRSSGWAASLVCRKMCSVKLTVDPPTAGGPPGGALRASVCLPRPARPRHRHRRRHPSINTLLMSAARACRCCCSTWAPSSCRTPSVCCGPASHTSPPCSCCRRKATSCSRATVPGQVREVCVRTRARVAARNVHS